MQIVNVGDLSGSYKQKLNTARIKTDMARLTEELSSGKIQNLRGETKGNFSVLASLEHQIDALGAYDIASKEAAHFGSTLQLAMESVQSNVESFAPQLLTASDGAVAAWVDTAAADARSRFSSVISAFNTQAADRSVLGGVATGRAPLADGETMLADLMTAVAGQMTAAGIETVVDAWFDDPGGGFETMGYLGSDTGLDPFRVGQNDSVRVDFKANDQEIRDVLKGYAMSALIDLGALSGQSAEKTTLTRAAGEQLLNANTGLSVYRGAIGAAEAAIDEVAARNASETSALELARNDLIAADPFTAAVELEAVQSQLETLFAITARASRLSLTEFLR